MAQIEAPEKGAVIEDRLREIALGLLKKNEYFRTWEPKPHPAVWIRAKNCCEYCGCDMLKTAAMFFGGCALAARAEPRQINYNAAKN